MNEKKVEELMIKIKEMEERIAQLESERNESQNNENYKSGMKYRLLSEYFVRLAANKEAKQKITFEQIEAISRRKLPVSATEHRAYWANTPSHSIALSWLGNGYHVEEVNLEEQYVVFVNPQFKTDVYSQYEKRKKNGEHFIFEEVPDEALRAMAREDVPYSLIACLFDVSTYRVKKRLTSLGASFSDRVVSDILVSPDVAAYINRNRED